jgi:hypothetical protein
MHFELMGVGMPYAVTQGLQPTPCFARRLLLAALLTQQGFRAANLAFWLVHGNMYSGADGVDAMACTGNTMMVMMLYSAEQDRMIMM